MDYEKFLIREYSNWSVYLHESQVYLGRCYLWAKRSDVLDFFDMNDQEQREYFEIGRELKGALKKEFNPDLYNYATLANISPHLHTHIIPRYAFPRNFAGRVFTDLNWGQNYVPYDKRFKLDESVLFDIKECIKKALKST